MRTLAIGIVLALARAVPSAGSLIATAAEATDQTKRIDHDVRLQNARIDEPGRYKAWRCRQLSFGRFLRRVLPQSFQRIHHHGPFANGDCR